MLFGRHDEVEQEKSEVWEPQSVELTRNKSATEEYKLTRKEAAKIKKKGRLVLRMRVAQRVIAG